MAVLLLCPGNDTSARLVQLFCFRAGRFPPEAIARSCFIPAARNNFQKQTSDHTPTVSRSRLIVYKAIWSLRKLPYPGSILGEQSGTIVSAPAASDPLWSTVSFPVASSLNTVPELKAPPAPVVPYSFHGVSELLGIHPPEGRSDFQW